MEDLPVAALAYAGSDRSAGPPSRVRQRQVLGRTRLSGCWDSLQAKAQRYLMDRREYFRIIWSAPALLQGSDASQTRQRGRIRTRVFGGALRRTRECRAMIATLRVLAAEVQGWQAGS